MTDPQPSAERAARSAERREWLAVLARTDAAVLEQGLRRCAPEVRHEYLRRPESGMVMLRGRMGGTGDGFNLGEATVTRCSVRLGDGQVGTGWVLGRDRRRAELVAVLDALLQEPAPDFYRSACVDRAVERAGIGLDPLRPTGVVMFGGQGSMQMLRIAQALRDVQLILLCGHNQTLAEKLRSMRTLAPHAVVGFTADVGRHMQLGDFFIGKPGPGCLSEAVQCALPVITFQNAWTMPQERYNAQWIEAQGIGLVLKSARALRAGVDELLARLQEFRARVERIDNHAVFEVVDILAGLLLAAATPDVSSDSGLVCAHAES